MKPTLLSVCVGLEEKKMENRKIKYTKMVIREGFLSLLAKKPIGKITVKDICEHADINRGTFYHYYKDVYHLQQVIEDEMFAKFESMQPLRKNSTLKEITTAAVSLLNKEREVSRAFLGQHGNTSFIERVLNMCRENTFVLYSDNGIGREDLDYIYNFMLFGSIKLIKMWVANDFKQKPEVIIGYISKLSKGSLSMFEKTGADE